MFKNFPIFFFKLGILLETTLYILIVESLVGVIYPTKLSTIRSPFELNFITRTNKKNVVMY